MTGSANTLPVENNWRFTLEFACLFFAISFTGLLIATHFALLKDGDTFWHVATGRWIAEHRTVPHTDVFSHTFTGQVWLAKEWLSQLILYYAYEIGGWKAVNAFSLLVVSVCVCAWVLVVESGWCVACALVLHVGSVR